MLVYLIVVQSYGGQCLYGRYKKRYQLFFPTSFSRIPSYKFPIVMILLLGIIFRIIILIGARKKANIICQLFLFSTKLQFTLANEKYADTDVSVWFVQNPPIVLEKIWKKQPTSNVSFPQGNHRFIKNDYKEYCHH